MSASKAMQYIRFKFAKNCETELEVIQESANRAGFLGYLRSAIKVALHLNALIYPGKPGPETMKLLLWVSLSGSGTGPSRFALTLKTTVGDFAKWPSLHMWRIWSEKVLKDMELLCRRRVVATLNATDAEVSRHLPRNQPHKFSIAIQAAGTHATVPLTHDGTISRFLPTGRTSPRRTRTDEHLTP
jgi:hypothetical protein